MKLTGDGQTVAVPRAMIALAPLDRAVNHQKVKSMATRFNNPLSPYEHPQSSVIFVPILRLGSEVLVVNGVRRPDITDAVIVGWKSWDFTGNLAAVQEALLERSARLLQDAKFRAQYELDPVGNTLVFLTISANHRISALNIVDPLPQCPKFPHIYGSIELPRHSASLTARARGMSARTSVPRAPPSIFSPRAAIISFSLLRDLSL